MAEALAHIRTRKLGKTYLAYTTDREHNLTLPDPNNSDPHRYVALTLAKQLTQSEDVRVEELSCYGEGRKYRVTDS